MTWLPWTEPEHEPSLPRWPALTLALNIPGHSTLIYKITEKTTFANILHNTFIIYSMQRFSLVCIRTITEAADVNDIICSFTRKLQFMFTNKVRTRPVINLIILNLITLIEKCSVVVVIEYVCSRNEDSNAHKVEAVPCSDAVSAHTTCVPRPSPTEPCSGPPLPSEPATANRTMPGHRRSDHTSQTSRALGVKCARARFKMPIVSTP